MKKIILLLAVLMGISFNSFSQGNPDCHAVPAMGFTFSVSDKCNCSPLFFTDSCITPVIIIKPDSSACGSCCGYCYVYQVCLGSKCEDTVAHTNMSVDISNIISKLMKNNYLANYYTENCFTITQYESNSCNTVDRNPTYAPVDTQFCLEPNPQVYLPRTVCAGDFFCNDADDNYLYKWYGCGLSSPWNYNPCFEFTKPCTYFIQIKDTADQCLTKWKIKVDSLHTVSVNISGDSIVCQETSVKFTATPTNQGSNPTYDWRVNGFLSGTNSHLFTTNTLNNGDKVKCILTSSLNKTCMRHNPDTSNTITMTVHPKPVITEEPVNDTICYGDTASFSLIATGDGLTYQWYRREVNIHFQLSYMPVFFKIFPLDTMLDAGYADTAKYKCIVTNGWGCKATSDTVSLFFNFPPVYLTNMIIDSSCILGSVTHSVNPTGTHPFSYQWFHNGNTIAAATNSAYTVNSVLPIDNGLYTCKISNKCGIITDTIFKIINTGNCCERINHIISGFVKYDNADSTPMTNTIVYLLDSSYVKIDSAITDNSGAYAFYCLINAKYKLTCRTSKPLGGVNPIDGLIVNRAYIGLYTFTDPLKKLAGDVNSDGKDNPIDALLINRRYINLVTQYPNNTPDWLFSNPTLIMDGENLTKNIKALCYGDVNGSYNPPQAIAPFDSLIIPFDNHSHSFNYNTLSSATTISLDSVVSQPGVGDTVSIPLRVGNFSPVGALGLKISYNQNVLKYVKVTNINPAIDTNFMYHNTSTSLNIAWSAEGNTALNLPNPGTILCNLKFVYTATGSDTTSLIFTNESVVSDTSLQPLSVIFQPGFIGPLFLTSSSKDTAVCLGTTASFTCSAASDVSDTNRIFYQWLKLEAGTWKLDTGQTHSTLSITNCLSNDAGNYVCVVSTIYGKITSNVATLTVQTSSPSILTEPHQYESACIGSSASFTVTPLGTSRLSYEWYNYESEIVGSDSILTINNVQDDYYSYYCIVSNACGSTETSSVSIKVNTPLTIAEQPISNTLCEGSYKDFYITVNGTNPLGSQWYRNDTLIPGATSDYYQIFSVNKVNNGKYYCLINNVCGTISTDTVSLTVNMPVNISYQSKRIDTICTGNEVSFIITPSGTPPFSYQWYSGYYPDYVLGTDSIYKIDSAASTDAGIYNCNITNICGEFNTSFMNNAYTLVVNTYPVLYSQPSDNSVCLGSGQTFTVESTWNSNPAYHYQCKWFKNDTILSGNNVSVGYYMPWYDVNYFINNVSKNDAGTYKCVISDVCGSVTSLAATLNINTSPSIIYEPLNDTVCSGSEASFTLSASGVRPLSYQWYQAYYGYVGNDSTLIINNASANNEYYCQISNACGEINTNYASIILNSIPTITEQPASDTLCPDSSQTLAVSANSLTPLSYQWLKNNIIIHNATSDNYQILNINERNAGRYECLVSNMCGTISSNRATLTVNDVPSIILQPISVTKDIGNSVTFLLLATGTRPLSYQWFKNDTIIPGAVNSEYRIQHIVISDTGKYFCIVTNFCKSLTSKTATLKIHNQQNRQIDTNQTSKSAGQIKDPTINIYPNPNDGSFTLELNLPSDGNVTLSAFNVIGEQVLSQQQYMQKGDNKLNLNLKGSDKGIYFFKVQTDTKTFNRKIIIE